MSDNPIIKDGKNQFPIVFRGYNVNEVDDYIRNEMPSARPEEICIKTFHSQFRGYDKDNVDAYLDDIIQQKKLML